MKGILDFPAGMTVFCLTTAVTTPPNVSVPRNEEQLGARANLESFQTRRRGELPLGGSSTVSNRHVRTGVAVWLLSARESGNERITEDLLNWTKDTQEEVAA